MKISQTKSLAHMTRSYLNPSQLGYLIFYVTNRCNFRCDFCFYYAEIEKGRKPNELTIEEIEKLSKTIVLEELRYTYSRISLVIFKFKNIRF